MIFPSSLLSPSSRWVEFGLRTYSLGFNSITWGFGVHGLSRLWRPAKDLAITHVYYSLNS